MRLLYAVIHSTQIVPGTAFTATTESTGFLDDAALGAVDVVGGDRGHGRVCALGLGLGLCRVRVRGRCRVRVQG